MKRLFYALMLVLSLGFTISSCKKIDEEIKEDEPKTVEITSITATLSPITKTELHDGYKVLWSPGDKICVLNKEGSATFTALNSEPTPTVEFKGSFSIPYREYSGGGPYTYTFYGVYPYSSDTTIEPAVPDATHPWTRVIIKTPLPSEQTAVAGSFSDDLAISVGTLSNDDLMLFHNVCGLFEFTLGREDVTKVSIRGNAGQYLAGTLRVLDDTDPGNRYPADVVDNGVGVVSLSTPEGTYFQKGTPYYFVLAPTVLHNGFTLTFNTDSGVLTKSVDKNIEIKSSVIGYMTNVDKDAVPSFVPFEDPLFKAYCIENFDKDEDGEIGFEEALEVQSIYFVAHDGEPKASSLSGIEFFTNLKTLNFSGHNVETIDLSNNTQLEALICPSNPLSELDLSNNQAVKTINVSSSSLSSLDVSNHPSLMSLAAAMCGSLITINASNNPYLKELSCPLCPSLSSIDVSNTPQLEFFEASDCILSSLDYSGHPIVTYFAVSGNRLTSLILSDCNRYDPYLGKGIMNCSSNQLTSLILDNVSLGTINCSDNQLVSLDLSTVSAGMIDCSNNRLTSLDLSAMVPQVENPVLSVDCTNNPLEYIYVPIGYMFTLAYPEGTELRYKANNGIDDYTREDWGAVSNNVIYYTTTDGEPIRISDDKMDANGIVSNKYVDGRGVLTFNKELTSLKYGIFDGCSTMSSVTLPESITTLDRPFISCINLSEIISPLSTSDERCLISNGKLLAVASGGLTSFIVPDEVTSLQSAFIGLSNLREVVLPAGLTSMGRNEFQGCTSLESITLPAGIRQIPEGAFMYCTNLSQVSMPVGVETIGKAAFDHCESLPSITIPESVTSIEAGAFFGCSSFTSITIPQGVTTIELYLFNGCSSLTSVTLPESVTSIGDSAFINCTSLASITLPASVTDIEYAAFRGCSSLTSITIPQNVTLIDSIDGVFEGCSSLTSIIVRPNNPPYLRSPGNPGSNDRWQIYVPAARVENYRNNSLWGIYADRIHSIDEM